MLLDIDEKMSLEEVSEEEEGAESRSFCGDVFRTLHPNSCPSSSTFFPSPTIASTEPGPPGSCISLIVNKIMGFNKCIGFNYHDANSDNHKIIRIHHYIVFKVELD
jgi:hypothetical protein